jgi:hypothetical protein
MQISSHDPRILLSSPHAKAVTTAPRFGNASFSGVVSSKYRQYHHIEAEGVVGDFSRGGYHLRLQHLT